MSEKYIKNGNDELTFGSLLQATFIAIFLIGVTSREEKQDYDIKDAWKTWFQTTYSKENINSFFQGLTKIIYKFALFFIVINILIFTPVVLGQLKSPRYPVERAYLMSSFMINRLYIFPLSEVFGYGNPLTWGFYPIKDSLYKVGMSKLPKNEGEREIWWYNIRFVEYKVLAQPTLSDSYTYNDKTYKKLPDWQTRSFERWNDELYQHIQSVPKAKISDPKLAKTKLMIFLDLAEAYIKSTYVLSIKTQVTTYGYLVDKDKELPGPKPEAVKNHMNVINIFNKLKSDSAKNDKESYNYFEKKKEYEEDKFLYEAAKHLLESEAQWGQISCESPEVNIFATSHKNLRKYYVKHYNDLKFGGKGTLEILITLSRKIPQCENSPAVVEYKKFHKEDSEYYKKYNRFKKIS